MDVVQSNAQPIDPAERFSIRSIAIAAFLLFAPVVATFAFAPGIWWADYPGIVFHLAMFLLVAKLPAPDWAKAAGYGWLLLDVMTGVLTLNGVTHAIADFVRLGGHVFGGTWIATASLSGSRAVKVIGVVVGVWLAGFTFVSPFLPMEFVGPTAILLLIWLLIIAWQDGSTRKSS